MPFVRAYYISLAQSFFVVAVRKEFPADTVADFIAYAKAIQKKSITPPAAALLPDNSAAGAFSARAFAA